MSQLWDWTTRLLEPAGRLAPWAAGQAATPMDGMAVPPIRGGGMPPPVPGPPKRRAGPGYLSLPPMEGMVEPPGATETPDEALARLTSAAPGPFRTLTGPPGGA